MNQKLLIGRGQHIIALPHHALEAHLAQDPEHSKDRFPFMTDDHQRVRYYVVRELPRGSSPIPPQAISKALHLSLETTQSILADLERGLFFLVRDQAGAVAWAYPVTAEPTPHHLHFDSGERIYAA